MFHPHAPGTENKFEPRLLLPTTATGTFRSTRRAASLPEDASRDRTPATTVMVVVNTTTVVSILVAFAIGIAAISRIQTSNKMRMLIHHHHHHHEECCCKDHPNRDDPVAPWTWRTSLPQRPVDSTARRLYRLADAWP
jgi:hypothetical protein